MLTVKEAAQRARVCRAMVYQWCDEGRLAHYRFGGRGKRGKILIEAADLEDFLQAQKVMPAPHEKSAEPPFLVAPEEEDVA